MSNDPDEFLFKSVDRAMLAQAIEAILIDVYHNTVNSWSETWKYESEGSRWTVKVTIAQ